MVDEDLNNFDMMGLSSREMEIIDLVADGLTNQEIAVKLTISKRTVDNHVSNMFTKTGSKNRVALLNWAMDHGKICRDGFNCCSLPDSDQSYCLLNRLSYHSVTSINSFLHSNQKAQHKLYKHLYLNSRILICLLYRKDHTFLFHPVNN